jgi:hypothetical protein
VSEPRSRRPTRAPTDRRNRARPSLAGDRRCRSP